MAIDRNARVRLANKVAADRSLTHAQRGIVRALLMKFLDCRTGRCRVDYDRLAEAAGCDRATVGRAVSDQKGKRRVAIDRYFEVHRSWKDRQGRNGGVVRGRDVNLYIVRELENEAPNPLISLQAQDATGTTPLFSIQMGEKVIHNPVDLLHGLNLEGFSRTERMILRKALRQNANQAQA